MDFTFSLDGVHIHDDADDDFADIAKEVSASVPMFSGSGRGGVGRGGVDGGGVGRGGGGRGRGRGRKVVSRETVSSGSGTVPETVASSSSGNDGGRVYLNVPFAEKDLAKQKGAKWDPARRKWWISNDKATADVIEKWGGITEPIVAPKEEVPRARSDASMRGWFDGGARGNPGHCGYGAVLRAGNGTVLGVRIGGWHHGTNNEAEYTGCRELLEMILGALRELPDGSSSGRRIEIRGDSKMVIQQLKGEWECHADNLRGLMERCQALIKEIRSLVKPDGEVVIEHVMRELNVEADALSNLGMDQVTPPSSSSASSSFRR